MISIQDFKRLINPIQKRISLIIGRALLTAVESSGKYQRVNITVMKGEAKSDIERAQEYGLESYPVVSSTSEAIVLFPNGSRDNGIVIKVQDREVRPTDLAEGEVVLYTTEDSTLGHRVHLKSGGTIEIVAGVLPLGGVVTNQCICAFTGNVHPDFSSTVKCSK